VTPVTPRPAASVLLVRNGARSPLEVYMIRRHKSMRFLGGYYAFPGGKVDPADASAEALARCRGLSAEAAARVIPPADGVAPLAFWVSGLRELLEETGVLLAVSDDGAPVATADPDVAARVDGVRRALLAGTAPLSALLDAQGWHLDLGALRYLSHFITPPSSPIRFTARFFLAPLPPGQDPRHGDEEASEGLWIDPAAGYRLYREGEMPMADPAECGLGYLSGFDSVESLWEAHADGRHKLHGILDRLRGAEADGRLRPPGGAA
jgi:8-oxo-dGTP pyrophosphatase MutT (NUDIX family)